MDQNAKSRIISAAKFLLTQRAMDKISTREIAELAKVSNATVGYYFSSKAKLFTDVLDMVIVQNQEKWLEDELLPGRLNKKDLLRYLEFLHRTFMAEDGFAKTRILSQIHAKTTNPANLKVCQVFYSIARRLETADTDRQLKVKVAMMFASVVNFSISAAEVEAFTELPLKSREGLDQYLRILVDVTFPDI